ncbi:transcriptional regulator [Sphaerisporangium melleum]|uniref:Transcriptional regulator n=1 Tax=Sphaerisporangium melleum TaxID=321316 RepID=A0A917VRN7_9ACTN|nr:helix-turn-helix transcriptional regulator [Sphaerisporangium melleum]GGL07620.1 transcriptional regulator [Sphaerisporangium melleum]GII68667.1 transcriptional regulator [Sphaerisporangium melleum]
MGVWRIGADVLARGRFTLSPLAETIGALEALHWGTPRPGRETWLRDHRPAYRARLDADPVEALLVWAALRPRWMADFIGAPPEESDRSFRDELERVRRTPPEVAEADLAAGLGHPVPAELRRPDLPERAAALLEWVWTATVRPEWPRLRRVLEADIVARTQALSSGGWAAALAGLRPGMRWLGDGRLQVNAYDNPPRDIADDARLTFIPVSAAHGWVCWDLPHRYGIVYPCAGLLADAPESAPPQALSRLLGPVRATVLCRLTTPMSTTQLVALTGYGLGSVGGHLKVLLDARLVQRRRSGRSVLYYRTSLGDRLAAPETAVRGDPAEAARDHA